MGAWRTSFSVSSLPRSQALAESSCLGRWPSCASDLKRLNTNSTCQRSFRVFCQAENLENSSLSAVFRVPGPPPRGAGRGRERGPRRGSCERLAGGRLRLPRAVVPQQGVDEGEQRAHDGDGGDLVLAALGGQASVEGLAGGMAADRGDSGHVQQLARMGSRRAGRP